MFPDGAPGPSLICERFPAIVYKLAGSAGYLICFLIMYIPYSRVRVDFVEGGAEIPKPITWLTGKETESQSR